MWLVHKHRILTKRLLQKKGWSGDLHCQFYQQIEDSNHLFFKCHYAQKIWGWVGGCQSLCNQWNSIADVIQFAVTLPKTQKTAFLIMVCAVVWII